jgi:hypothetical protein
VNNKKNLVTKLGNFWLVVCLGLVMTGCGLLPLGQDEPAPPPPTLTDTEVPIQVDTATATTIPTRTMIPSPTLSPTTRPTWTPFPTKTLRPTWTPSPTLSPTATKDIGWYFKDDFSEVSTWWLRKDASNWATGYARGGYFMQVKAPYVEITASPSYLKLDDTRVIVDVYRQHGHGYYGIECRETVAGNYYTIFITSDGQYGYGETRNTRVELVFLGRSNTILTGLRQVNRIMASCRGNFLSLTVNDVPLFRTEVEGIGPGWVGLMTGTTTEQETVTVIYDNIEIWGPLMEEGVGE